MVWGAIGYDKRMDMVLAEGRLNACQYVARMVNLVVIPFMSWVPNGIFQLDNTRPNIAVHTRNVLDNVDP